MMKRFLLWLLDHTLGITFVLSLFTIFGIAATQAATTSYLVANETQMFLDVNLTTTQTTGIVLAAPQLNGSNWTFATTTGGVLRIRQGTRREDIYYTSASVNATTFKVTLSGVTRNICPQAFTTYVTCGAGQQFSRGAIVELIQDARLFNLSAKTDRANLFTASGGVNFPLDASGSLSFPQYSNTTSRDHNVQALNGKTACSTTDGVCYFYMAGGWNTFGTSTTSNATDTTAGKVQLVSLVDLQNRAETGSAAHNVLTPRWIVKNGTGTVSAGRVPQLNRNGVISTTMGGTGTGGVRGVASGTILTSQGTGAFKGIYPGTNGQVIKSNGTEWVKGTDNDSSFIRDTRLANGTAFGASSVAVINLGSGVVLTGSTLAVGDVIHLVGSISVTQASSTFSGTLMLGGTKIYGNTTDRGFTATATTGLNIDAYLIFTDTDSNGSVTVVGTFSRCTVQATCTVISLGQVTSGINFTSNLRLQFAGKFNGSDAGNNAIESGFYPIFTLRKY